MANSPHCGLRIADFRMCGLKNSLPILGQSASRTPNPEFRNLKSAI